MQRPTTKQVRSNSTVAALQMCCKAAARSDIRRLRPTRIDMASTGYQRPWCELPTLDRVFRRTREKRLSPSSKRQWLQSLASRRPNRRRWQRVRLGLFTHTNPGRPGGSDSSFPRRPEGGRERSIREKLILTTSRCAIWEVGSNWAVNQRYTVATRAKPSRRMIYRLLTAKPQGRRRKRLKGRDLGQEVVA
jgi:hypothetical protein